MSIRSGSPHHDISPEISESGEMRFSVFDDPVEHCRAALENSPCNHTRVFRLHALANVLQDRYEERGQLSDLNEALELNQAALDLTPDDPFDRSNSLSILGHCFWRRFEQEGLSSDLDRAIELHQAAMDICLPDPASRLAVLNNFAIALWSRFRHQGLLSDLNKAIELHQAALECEPGPFHEGVCLNNLAACFQYRFEQQGLISDLNKAIEINETVLELRPPGHPDRDYSLNNLAFCLRSRFEHQDYLPDLDKAIELHQTAVEICPPGHSGRDYALNNLAICFQKRFEKQNVPSDLDKALELHRASLELRPSGHPRRFLPLNDLAYSLQLKVEKCQEISLLTEAYKFYEEALDRCPEGYHYRAKIQARYAQLLLSHAQQQSTVDDAFLHYRSLSSLPPFAVSQDGFIAASSWASNAEKFKHESVLDAYTSALTLLDHVVNFAPSATLRHEILQRHASTLSVDAFSCGVRHAALKTAVELLERGRGILWSQLARYRTPVDELSGSGDSGKELAASLVDLSQRIRRFSNSSSEQELSQVRRLQPQFDDILSQIRQLTGFSQFLLPPTFADLRQAARDGPVIIVNASEYSCDAVIIHIDSDDPVHVPLKNITKREVADLASTFRCITGSYASSAQRTRKIVVILRALWTLVVEPIVEALEHLHVPRHSRIWWCATAEFTALPLHAAGPYRRAERGLLRKYVSSYTPTLTALLRARARPERATNGDSLQQRFVAISQGKAYDTELEELDNVDREIELVAQRLDLPALGFTKLSGNEATVEAVRDALCINQFVHLACHGISDADQPLLSSFAMGDGPLELLHLINTDMQHPQFAFLSACHTAAYNKSIPDEVIHLAAGMLFAGFQSVVGTMWSVDDTVVTRLVEAFYERLLDGSTRLDSSRAAVALNQAIIKLSKDDQVPLEQRIVFIHIGV